MNFEFALPSVILQPYIKQYWAIDVNIENGEEFKQRIVATCLSHFMNIPMYEFQNQVVDFEHIDKVFFKRFGIRIV